MRNRTKCRVIANAGSGRRTEICDGRVLRHEQPPSVEAAVEGIQRLLRLLLLFILQAEAAYPHPTVHTSQQSEKELNDHVKIASK